MPWLAPIAMAAGAGAQAGLGASAADQQLNAAKTAAQDQRDTYQQAENKAEGAINTGMQQGAGALQGGLNQSLASLGGARSDLQQGYGQGASQLQALQGLQGFTGGATTAIGAYDVTRGGGRLANLADNGFNFQADPGYQFRQQQGEQAIQRQASASGGRLSGSTLQALASFNQNLASDEYSRAYGRAAQSAGAADQMQASLLMNQAGRTDAAGLAAQQNQYGLAQMGYGANSQLAQLYGQQGQGLAGLGQAAAGYQYGTGQNLAGMYGSGASQLAGVYGQTGQQMAGTYELALGLEGGRDAYLANMAGQGVEQGLGLMKEGGQAAAAAMSDRGQKKNIVQINASTAAANPRPEEEESSAPAAPTQASPTPEEQKKKTGNMQKTLSSASSSVSAGASSFAKAIASDKRGKTNVSGETPEGMMDTLRAYGFDYKDTSLPGTSPGRQYGVMAQDVEKTKFGKQIVKQGPHGKMLDPTAAIGPTLASLGNLNKRVKKLEKGKR